MVFGQLDCKIGQAIENRFRKVIEDKTTRDDNVPILTNSEDQLGKAEQHQTTNIELIIIRSADSELTRIRLADNELTHIRLADRS